MLLPVTYLGLGAGALDLLPVRARRRLESAALVVSDDAERLAALSPQAERVEARSLGLPEIVAKLRVAHEQGLAVVRAVSGTLGESMRALDELRLLLEANVLLEVLGAHAGDTIRWPWRDRLPLAGRRIAVTRRRAADDALSDLLLRLGAEIIEAPAQELAPPNDLGALDRAIDGLHRYSFLVFTSALGVQSFFDRLIERGKDARWLAGLKLAVVGPGTAKALRDRGLLADVAPEEFRGEALAQAIAAQMGPGARVLIARNQEGREALPVELAKAGAMADVVAVYQMRPPPTEAFAPLKQKLEAKEVDLVTFASGAAARSLVAGLGVQAFAGVPIACLGPVTAEGAKAAGLEPTIVAPSASFEELAEAIARQFSRPRESSR
ncbi:MAG: uroporphyrinogen-III synthase [Deltaproteobacteria bacterium]|nr:uroporphyrinogen-III synthase [Deltaproteobacteria bacterium]